MNTIPFRAEVSPNILKKADRLFSNRLSAILIELIQNSRRAGASLITVNATQDVDDTTLISFEDDGIGVEDFSALLHLGHSDWDSEIERRDGPAGMGFFSLIHTGVLVQSRGMSAFISPEAFMGMDSVTVEPSTSAPAKGTRLSFRRTEQVQTVINVLTQVAQYGSVDVLMNGVSLVRRDFLEGSLYTKVVDGVRIGVFSGADYRTLCNFHGSVIELRNRSSCLSDVTISTAPYAAQPGDLSVKIDVLETASLHLKHPDRSQVVEDKAFVEMMRKVRTTLYEYLATLPVHCASYASYQEAHSLGVELTEASPYMRCYYVSPLDNDRQAPFSLEREDISTSIVDLSRVALVEHPSDACDLEAFTFEVGRTHFQNALPLTPLELSPRYKGFKWYDSLPRYQNFMLLIDGKPATMDEDRDLLTIVNSIEIGFELKHREGKTVPFSWRVPFAGHANEDGYFDRNCCLYVSKDSTWATQSDPYAQPFSLTDAAQYLGFSYRDDVECDSYDTQLDHYNDSVTGQLTRALGGELALVRMELAKITSHSDLTYALNAASISGVRLSKGEKGWTFEITT